MHSSDPVDPARWPNDAEPESLAGELEALGIPPDAVPRLRVIATRESLVLTTAFLRDLLRKLAGTAEGLALRRALAGSERPLAEDAAAVGLTKHSLAMRVSRVRRKLEQPR